jgi:hypothetical protein
VNTKISNYSFDNIHLDIENDTIGGIPYNTENIGLYNNSFSTKGLSVNPSVEIVNITNNTFSDITTESSIFIDGNLAEECTGVSILTNGFDNCAGAGVIPINIQYVNGIDISHITANGIGSIMCSGCDSIQIKDNYILSPTTHSIRISSSTNIEISGNTITGSGFRGVSLETGSSTPVKIHNNRISTSSIAYYNVGTYTNVTYKDNVGYIAPGETRSASGALTAGNANAIAFAWNNPEAQDVYIKKVVITVTTPGGTAGSGLQVGIADDAVGTNLGTEFANTFDLNTAAVYDSTYATDNGTQVKWVFCQDSASATDGWVVGQILDANAASLVGTYYIEYVGK